MATFEQAAKAISQTMKDAATKAKKISADRKEASRLASLANKRAQRLANNGLEDSPAYQMYIKTGGKFGVKGKTHNELQQEVSRLKRFIDMNTSTVKGVTNTLKEMAANTGISYANMKELKQKSSKFFELASKVEQYLRTVEDMASAIGYQKIWETINQYVKSGEIDLSSADGDIDGMVKAVTDAIKQYETPINNRTNGKWFKLADE